MNEKVVQEYMIKLGENQMKLHRLLSYMISKSYADVRDISYGSLGDLLSVSESLDEIIDFLQIKED